jgi:cation transport regulator ChaB
VRRISMPYSSTSSLPDYVKKLPAKKQKQWMAVFNTTYNDCKSKGGSDCEKKAFKYANGVVKNSESGDMSFLAKIISLVQHLEEPAVDAKSVFKSVVASYTTNKYYAVQGKNIVALGYELPADCEDVELAADTEEYVLVIGGEDYNDVSVKTFDAGTKKMDVTAAALDLVENGRNNVRSVEVCKLMGKKFAGRSVYNAQTQYYYVSKDDSYDDVPIDDVLVRKELDKALGDGEVVKITKEVNILKSTGTLRKGLVYGIVYAPDDTDTHGDHTSAEEIENAAHEFLPSALKNGVDGWTDINHKEDVKTAKIDEQAVVVVESYIAPCDFKVGEEPVKKGSWLVVSKVRDTDLIKRIESDEITGYSLEGYASKV